MTEEFNPSVKSNIIRDGKNSQNTDELTIKNPQRSDAFYWLMNHYETINSKRIYWKNIVKKFNKLGFKNKANQTYSTQQIGDIWRNVKKNKKIEDTLNIARTENPIQPLKSSPPSLTQLANPASFISNEQKKEIIESKSNVFTEMTKGEEWAAKQKAKILQQINERKKRV